MQPRDRGGGAGIPVFLSRATPARGTARRGHRAGREGRRVALEGHPPHGLQHPPLSPGGRVSSSLGTLGLHQPLITLGDNNGGGGRPEAGGAPPQIRSRGGARELRRTQPPLPGQAGAGGVGGACWDRACFRHALQPEPWVSPSAAVVVFFFWLQLYLFTGCIGFRCFEGFSLVAASGGCSPVAVRGLLTAVAPLAGERGLQVHGPR